MTWNVEWDNAAVKELRKLDKQVQKYILKCFSNRISIDDDLRRFGKPLSRELAGLWRYRVRHYRIISNIEDDTPVVLVVLVLQVGHRKDVYE